MSDNPQCITVNDEVIRIQVWLFVQRDFSFTRSELLLDVFSNYYRGQKIVINVFDGENVEYSGFVKFIEQLCIDFNIDRKKVWWQTHNLNFNTQFSTEFHSYSIFRGAWKHMPDGINKDLTGSKFVGMALGRFNPTRFRLAYEIDQAFPGDNFCIFQAQASTINSMYINVSDLYTKELEWFRNKTFDQDLQTQVPWDGHVDWILSCANYGNIWNKYQIEIVSETDAMSEYWLTEKTARCLITGKPFVLLSGQGSLAYLKNLGFQTFSSVINEDYDICTTPTLRIRSIITSLRELYTSPDRDQRLNAMKQIAQSNIEIHKKFANPSIK